MPNYTPEELARLLIEKGQADIELPELRRKRIYRVVGRTKRGLLVRHEEFEGRTNPALSPVARFPFVFYMPNELDHANAIMRALPLVRKSDFNEKIGPFAAWYAHLKETRRTVRVLNVQGNFSNEAAKTYPDPSIVLPRNVSNAHSGGRQHLFEYLIGYAAAHGKTLVLNADEINRKRARVPPVDEDPLARNLREAVRNANAGDRYAEVKPTGLMKAFRQAQRGGIIFVLPKTRRG